MLTVLVLSAGGLQGYAILASLRKISCREIRVLVGDSNEHALGMYFCHKYFQLPNISDTANYKNALLSLCLDESVDLIIPSTAYELSFLASLKEKNPTGHLKIAIPSSKLVRLFSDKQETYTLAESLMIPVAPFICAPIQGIEFPVISKPRTGWGGKGMVLLSSHDELVEFCGKPESKDYLFQKFIAFMEEFSIDFSIGFDKNMSPYVMRRRICTSGGFTIVSSLFHDEIIVKYVNKLSQFLIDNGGIGLWNIQFMRDKEGNIFLSDVNPRVGTSSTISVELGVNIVEYLIDSINAGGALVSEKSEPMTFAANNHYVVRYLKEKSIKPFSRKTVDGIVFDLDDTLIDHKKWLKAKLVLFLNEYRSAFEDNQYFFDYGEELVESGSISKIVDILVAASNNEPTKSRLIEMYHFWRTCMPEISPCYPDVKVVLKELQSRGYKLGLLTDNPISSQKQKISASGLAKYFETIVYSQEINSEKPDKKVFSRISEKMEIKPAHLVMVGDNLFKDIKGSKLAGFYGAVQVQRPGVIHNSSFEAEKRASDIIGGFNKIESIDTILNIFP
ncbi:MAG: HAD-IA family hydrolase [Xanthomonadales bacterium]|nr:HAD-IA family hydrolase [Xanthomonadales bacterium]